MTRREELLEQLEESVFALMMDEVAQEEGRKALEENERLKNDESFVVPKSTYRKGMTTIKQHFSQKNRGTTMRTVSKIVSKVAVIVLVLLLLFTTAFATIPEFRVKTLNLIVEVFDDRTRIEFGDGTPAAQAEETGRIVGWVPEGFALVEQSKTKFTVRETYENLEGASVNVYINRSTSIWEVDTENATIEDVLVNGCPAMIISKGNLVQFVCPVRESECVYYVKGEEVSEDIVMRVAESMDIR